MHSYELSINGISVKFFGLTIPEINVYLNEVIAQKKGEGYYQEYYSDILSCTVDSIVKNINDEEYKLATICFCALQRKQVILKLYERGYITFDDIVSIEKVCPEIYYCLPLEMYVKYPTLVNDLFNNKRVSYDKLPSSVRKYFKIEGFYKPLTNDDHLSIYSKYLVAGLTEKEFCFYYKIDNIEGFKTLVDYLGTELSNNKDELIKESENIIAREIDNVIVLINEGKITFQQYLNRYFDYTHRSSYVMPKLKDQLLFANQMIEYILEFRDKLQFDKIRIFFGNHFKVAKNEILNFMDKLQFDRKIRLDVANLLEKYNLRYSEASVKQKISKNGVVIADINDDVIKEGYKYLRDHDICICNYTMDIICKKIAMGEPIIDRYGINRVREK